MAMTRKLYLTQAADAEAVDARISDDLSDKVISGFTAPFGDEAYYSKTDVQWVAGVWGIVGAWIGAYFNGKRLRGNPNAEPFLGV